MTISTGAPTAVEMGVMSSGAGVGFSRLPRREPLPLKRGKVFAPTENNKITLEGDANAGGERDEDSIIRIEHLHKTYLLGLEGVAALRGVTLNVRRGEFLVIFGASGGGKSSLLRLMGTIDLPTKGNVHFAHGAARAKEGLKVTSQSADSDLADLRLYQLGYVFQAANLHASLTALESVMLPLQLQGWGTAKQRRNRALALLKRVGMETRASHKPNELSGGEKSRVAICRALAKGSGHPSCLFLDEPTGDLDSVNTAMVNRLLCDLNEEGVTCVMVTHNPSLRRLAHRAVYMVDGKIARIEKVPEEVRSSCRGEMDDFLVQQGKGEFLKKFGDTMHDDEEDHADKELQDLEAAENARKIRGGITMVTEVRDLSSFGGLKPIAIHLPGDLESSGEPRKRISNLNEAEKMSSSLCTGPDSTGKRAYTRSQTPIAVISSKFSASEARAAAGIPEGMDGAETEGELTSAGISAAVPRVSALHLDTNTSLSNFAHPQIESGESTSPFYSDPTSDSGSPEPVVYVKPTLLSSSVVALPPRRHSSNFDNAPSTPVPARSVQRGLFVVDESSGAEGSTSNFRDPKNSENNPEAGTIGGALPPSTPVSPRLSSSSSSATPSASSSRVPRHVPRKYTRSTRRARGGAGRPGSSAIPGSSLPPSS